MRARVSPLLLLVAVGACSNSQAGALGPEKSITPDYLLLERSKDSNFSTLTAVAGRLDELRFTAVETVAEVRVHVLLGEYESRGEAEPACAISMSVTLRSPLSGRPVVDERSGRPVEVR